MTDRLEFEVRVPPDHPSLAGHFPGNPVVPGALLLDAILAGLEQATGRRAIGLQQVKFLAVLRPDEHAVAQCAVEESSATFRAYTRWGAAAVLLASGTVWLQTACSGNGE